MVALSDVPTDFAGNFTVWPGSHLLYERYFQTHDVRDMLHGTPRLEHLPEPTQLRVRAGDLVLAHYQLGHTGAPNLSAHVRYAVFFRLYHEHHDADALDILADIWREFPSLVPRGQPAAR
jgi:ectoine hydroxylase-related dioxygenase (phytanoyl-CoA dioxygenase family)